MNKSLLFEGLAGVTRDRLFIRSIQETRIINHELKCVKIALFKPYLRDGHSTIVNEQKSNHYSFQTNEYPIS